MLPQTIKIGYHQYRLELVPGLEDNGSAHLDTKLIQINASLPPSAIRDTLLHEVLHVLLGDSALPACKTMEPELLEEHIVLLLSPSLLQFFRDNPQIRSYLMEL